MANSVEKRFTYRVREAFAAEFSCERETPRRPACRCARCRCRSTPPVPRKLAMAIRLKSAERNLLPRMDGGEDGGDADSVINGVQFDAPLPEQTSFTLELPKDFKDASGRTCAMPRAFR